jgi:hypothetical protein
MQIWSILQNVGLPFRAVVPQRIEYWTCPSSHDSSTRFPKAEWNYNLAKRRWKSLAVLHQDVRKLAHVKVLFIIYFTFYLHSLRGYPPLNSFQTDSNQIVSRKSIDSICVRSNLIWAKTFDSLMTND